MATLIFQDQTFRKPLLWHGAHSATKGFSVWFTFKRCWLYSRYVCHFGKCVPTCRYCCSSSPQSVVLLHLHFVEPDLTSSPRARIVSAGPNQKSIGRHWRSLFGMTATHWKPDGQRKEGNKQEKNSGELSGFSVHLGKKEKRVLLYRVSSW